jgi:hypothetical protein
MSTYDDELPAGYQDADLEMRELEDQANDPSSYCECDTPVMDIEHDAGCRRCGRPVNFTPAKPTEFEIRQAIAEYDQDREPSAAEEGAREVAEHLERKSRQASEGHDITTAAGRRARSIARQDARLLATGNATYPPNTPIEVKTSGYEFAHGKKPSGTGTWAFQLGDDDRPEHTYWFTGRYTDGRKAAMRAARWRGKDTIEVLP